MYKCVHSRLFKPWCMDKSLPQCVAGFEVNWDMMFLRCFHDIRIGDVP